MYILIITTAYNSDRCDAHHGQREGNGGEEITAQGLQFSFHFHYRHEVRDQCKCTVSCLKILWRIKCRIDGPCKDVKNIFFPLTKFRTVANFNIFAGVSELGKNRPFSLSSASTMLPHTCTVT